MKVESKRHLHGRYHIPRRTADLRMEFGWTARKALQDCGRCSRCSLRDISFRGISAQNDAILVPLDRDCELRHLYLRHRWQGTVG